MSENTNKENKKEKSPRALNEEKMLKVWREKGIFEKSLAKESPKGQFVFYEGPPTANGHPGIHHLEARAFKDAIPRYKTMRGYKVRRKGGWDTHGLPVEIQVEKELGLKSKKEVEAYGIGRFNEKCKESVWKYVHEWEDFTARMGYWVDLKNPYITYKSDYIESVWNIIREVENKGLLYKDYKVVPWCPRCGTGLSSHELAQGYEDVKDLSVTVKFKVKSSKFKGKSESQLPTYLLAWTTTPWTLPGNVGLAVGKEVAYKVFEKDGRLLIAAAKRAEALGLNGYEVDSKEFKGEELVGLEYEPLFSYLAENAPDSEKDKIKNAYKVYAADFVTTEDGTGIVHTAVMYGQEDFELGTAVGLPKVHMVSEDGTFKKNLGYLSGRFVKEKDEKGKPTLDVDIIEDLKKRDLFFSQESYKHSYPHCWRCKTPLIYYARDSWYIKMSTLREKLVKENEGIHWEPEYIKDGRFGEWLAEIKDWAISRERYWGTPLPVWLCSTCNKRKVVGSVAELARKPKNNYWVMRHGEAENNTKEITNGLDENLCHLTEKGKEMAEKALTDLKAEKIDLIYVSPFARTVETAQIAGRVLGLKEGEIIKDKNIKELGYGILENHDVKDFREGFPLESRFQKMPEGGETYDLLKKRMGDFLYSLEEKHQGKNILIITHATPALMLLAAAAGLDRAGSIRLEEKNYIGNAEIRSFDFKVLPHNAEYELDLHRPHIDEVILTCECGGEMKRVKEVMDVWLDSGAMPFAEDHYPFENREQIEKGGYPGDFISEAIDQTRGWFYTLHAIGILMDKGKAYKNVICLGHILDANGKKMSKSIGNIVNPFEVMDKYGADAARFWMYSVNQPGESKNFDEKTVDEIVKKVFNLASNVLSFYGMYCGPLDKAVPPSDKSNNVLDKWLIARLAALNDEVTKNLEAYKFLEPSRAVRDFIGDLSQWYTRRSRDRFKGEGKDKEEALATTRYVLLTLAKIMAPFTPFFAEELYAGAGGERESVHLEDWPELDSSFGKEERIMEKMEVVRYLSSKGLEARSNAKINVRQPLAKLSVKSMENSSGSKDPSLLSGASEYIELIMDEVNVKEVVFDAPIDSEVELDTVITPELKEEGELRELLRKIQDLRKEKGLSVGQIATLVAPNDLKDLISKNEAEIRRITSLSGIEYGEGELEISN